MAGTRSIDLRAAPVHDDIEVWDDDLELADDEDLDDSPARPRRRWRRFLLTVAVCLLTGWLLGSSSASARVTAAQEQAVQAQQGQVQADQAAKAAIQAQKNAESALATAQQQLEAVQTQLARARAASGSDPSPTGAGGTVHYRNCAAAKAAGAAPLHAGDAGYDRHLDRDGDGTACE